MLIIKNISIFLVQPQSVGASERRIWDILATKQASEDGRNFNFKTKYSATLN